MRETLLQEHRIAAISKKKKDTPGRNNKKTSDHKVLDQRYLPLLNPKEAPHFLPSQSNCIFTDSLVITLPPFITPPPPLGCPALDFHTANFLDILVKKVVHRTPRIITDGPKLLGPGNSGNIVGPGSRSSSVDGGGIERSGVTDQRLLSEPLSLSYDIAGNSAIITNDSTVVVAMVIRVVATVLLLEGSILVGLAKLGDLSSLDNLVDRGIFETAVGRGGVVGVGVVGSTTNASDFSLLDNGAAVGVESGITEVAVGLAVTVVVTMTAVRVAVAAIVEGFADTGDLGLFDNGVAMTIVDYSIVAEATIVAVAND